VKHFIDREAGTRLRSILNWQIEERNMKRNAAIALAMLLSAMGSQLPSTVLAQKSIPGELELVQREALLPPRIDRPGVRATLLHWGMSTGDVERIMGAPAQADSSAISAPISARCKPATSLATRSSSMAASIARYRLDAGVSRRPRSRLLAGPTPSSS
jgi:hypothetical protein